MCAELDAIISQPGHPAVVYFVDDNFIANRKATREMLPHLVEWQKKNDYPLQFACEATLNMAKQPEILELMRQANFMTVFVGIETPEADALKGIDKTHNAAVPMYEAIQTLNSYGLEVTSGIILGLDSDTDTSEQNLIDFIDKSAIPVLTINLLQALPKTPLWDRLEREGRLLHDITARGHTTGAEIARALGVDPAYVSRILRRFIDEDLVALTPNPADRRSNSVALTREGDAAYAELDAASRETVAALLERLGPLRRDALLAAMRTIRTALDDETYDPGPVILRPLRIGDIGWMIHRQGLLYAEQYGWNIEFESLIAAIYAEYQVAPDAPPRNLWVAERGGAIVGSIFCMASAGLSDSAQLRMLYVEPEARGLGIGRTLVAQCVAFARDSGYARMRLWTHSIQAAARRIYAGAGFELVESEPHLSFGKELVSEIWELRF